MTAISGVASERDMLELLHRHFGECGPAGAPRFTVAEQVPDVSGGGRRRCVDAVVQDLWSRDGYALHGVEVKVSRADWLAELRQPAKAETFRRHMDRWWLAAASWEVVRDTLPVGWGLLLPDYTGARLRVATSAPRLRPEPMPAAMRAALIRAAAKTAAARASGGQLAADCRVGGHDDLAGSPHDTG